MILSYIIVYVAGIATGLWIMEDFYLYGSDNKQEDHKTETDKGKV